MKAIFINAKARTVTQVNLGQDYKEIQQLLGCRCFTIVELENNNTLYVDDEGLLGNPRDFFTIDDYPQPIAGNGVILGDDGFGDSCDVNGTVEDIDRSVIFMDIATVLLKQQIGANF